jgi:hypothetical protein
LPPKNPLQLTEAGGQRNSVFWLKFGTLPQLESDIEPENHDRDKVTVTAAVVRPGLQSQYPGRPGPKSDSQ